ncbi:nucleotide disphospho-sugar-binding domain-containing protein [Rhodoligotrophos defluvii]|uniref:nucleotide disphospho-sugar-binding domain-containing protein n=1 Tax=Rhodoligotrophos defluvii TaxID=2561934 RepID=UPI0010C9DCC7|nr:nucleotide disphospho-sugar-binding domain-containing protein [Rhodoligotrophos defluvii]
MVQRKILLGWEMGSGLGHVVPLKLIGEALKRRGHAVVYGVQNSRSALDIGIECREIRQAPHWTPGARRPPLPPGYSAFTFGQILGLFGIGEAEATARMIREWSRLLEAERPDVVISDFAPGLNLAARGRYPLLVFGNGYTHPPEHLERFPRLWRTDATPYYDEDRLLDSLDRVLAAEGRPRLYRLPAIMAGQASAVRTFSLLDPYRDWRQTPPLAPILSHVPQPLSQLGDEVLCAALPRFMSKPDFVEGLARLDLPGRLLAHNMGETGLDKLRGTPWQVERQVVDLGARLSATRMVVGYGGLGFASLALAAGLPQLILYTDNEKYLTGRALQRAGVARAIHIDRLDADTFVKTVARLYLDPAVQARAHAHAMALAPVLEKDPVASVVEMACTLL